MLPREIRMILRALKRGHPTLTYVWWDRRLGASILEIGWDDRLSRAEKFSQCADQPGRRGIANITFILVVNPYDDFR